MTFVTCYFTVAAFRRGSRFLAEMRAGTTCLHFSYPDSIRTRARRFLRCIPSQKCFELLTTSRTNCISTSSQVCFEPLTRTANVFKGWRTGSSLARQMIKLLY
jgi:hypothetical protein